MGQRVESSVLHVLTYHEHLGVQRTRRDALFLASHQKIEEDNDGSQASLVQPSKQSYCLSCRALKQWENRLSRKTFESLF